MQLQQQKHLLLLLLNYHNHQQLLRSLLPLLLLLLLLLLLGPAMLLRVHLLLRLQTNEKAKSDKTIYSILSVYTPHHIPAAALP